MSRVGCYVRFRALPGQRAPLTDHLLEASRLMSGQPGCELYVVNHDQQDPDLVWVTEIWRSSTEHERSLSAPGVRELIGQALPMLDGAPERTDLYPLGGPGLVASDDSVPGHP